MSSLLRTYLTLALLLALRVPVSAQSPDPYPNFDCGPHPVVSDLLSHTSLDSWSGWIRRLSGDIPVTIAGKSTRITLRHSQTFTRSDSAFQYVLEQLQSWSADPVLVSIQPFMITSLPDNYESRNLILDLPGAIRPGEVIILAAHLDTLSTSVKDPAPGADDNGTGVATLLEAARLLRHYRFERTIRLVFFSGEEQIEEGSRAYLSGLDASSIVGVLNLDMFGYDRDNDRCFEMHVGTLPASDRIGRCFVESIQSNDLDLTFDYLTDDAIAYSDHATFWDAGLGAVLVLENYFNHNQPSGCRGSDYNPNYHTPDDRIQSLNLPYGFDIARAALAATASMAGPLGNCFDSQVPSATAGIIEGEIRLGWQSVPGAATYRVLQYPGACGQGVPLQVSTTAHSWISPARSEERSSCLQVEAVAGQCISYPSTPRTASSPSSKSAPINSGMLGWRLSLKGFPLY